MAILRMSKVNICGLKSDRKRVLEVLQRKGCLEIIDTNAADEQMFERMNTQTQVSLYERNSALADNALAILDEYAPSDEKISSLNGRRIVDISEYGKIANQGEKLMSLVNDIIAQGKVIDEQNNEIARCNEEIVALTPWMDLDVPMNFEGTKKTGFACGMIPGSYTQSELVSMIEDRDDIPDEMYFQVVSTEKLQTYVTCVFLKDKKDEAENAMRALGFTKPPILIHHTPKISAGKREARIEKANGVIEENIKLLEEEAKSRDKIQELSDYYAARSDKYKVLGKLDQSKHTFVISGYMPEVEVEDLRKELENNYGVYFEVEPVAEGDNVPVLLKNNAFSGPVEGVVESYGLPGKKEFDPTVITSFFYYFFFGMMLSDAAYGFIMFIVCFILLKKKKNMEGGIKQMLTMFMYCGLSTLFWGIMFGGYFGDAPTVIAKTFFDTDFKIPPLWFEPITNPMSMLIYCMLFGLVHLFVGLALNGYKLLKQKDYMGFIGDVICWYLLLIGLILMLLPTDLFGSLMGSQIVFPSWVGVMSKVMAIVGALGIIILAGRRSKNPFKRLLLGAYSLYDITSWLSDLLSYSRLLALGLATGVIAQVINMMGAMKGKSVAGVIMFVIVFLIGHTFNMAINLLGAYVHTNRLQYVEFFGKFYEGEGREFKPFKANTKYVKVKEN